MRKGAQRPSGHSVRQIVIKIWTFKNTLASDSWRFSGMWRSETLLFQTLNIRNPCNNKHPYGGAVTILQTVVYSDEQE